MNPTGQPQPLGAGSPPPSGAALDAVKAPSIFLMICGVLGILAALFSLVGGGVNEEQMQRLMNDPNIPPAAKAFFGGSGVLQKVWALVMLAVNGLVIFGGLQMMKLQSRTLAMTAAIIALVPCCFNSICCIFAIPAGIWALVVLGKPEVKSAFPS